MNENTKNEAATVSVICCDIAFSVNWRLHGLSALRENRSRQYVLFYFIFFKLTQVAQQGSTTVHYFRL